MNSAGDYSGAAVLFDEAIELLRSIDGQNGGDTLATFLSNAGANAVDAGDYQAAGTYLKESAELFSQLADSSGEISSAGASAAYNYGLVLYRRSEYKTAESVLTETVGQYELIYEQSPSRQNLAQLVQARSTLAACLTDEGSFEQAMEVCLAAIPDGETLAQDSENSSAQTALAELYNNCGLCCNMRGDYAAAGDWYEKALTVRQALYADSESTADQALCALSNMNAGENAFKGGDYTASEQDFEQGLDLLEPVCQSLGDYYEAQYLSWLSFYQLAFQGDYQSALTSSARAVELQPELVLAYYYYGYALMYNGEYEQCDEVFSALADLGQGAVTNISLDFDALTRAGLYREHMDAVLEIIAG